MLRVWRIGPAQVRWSKWFPTCYFYGLCGPGWHTTVPTKYLMGYAGFGKNTRPSPDTTPYYIEIIPIDTEIRTATEFQMKLHSLDFEKAAHKHTYLMEIQTNCHLQNLRSKKNLKPSLLVCSSKIPIWFSSPHGAGLESRLESIASRHPRRNCQRQVIRYESFNYFRFSDNLNSFKILCFAFELISGGWGQIFSVVDGRMRREAKCDWCRVFDKEMYFNTVLQFIQIWLFWDEKGRAFWRVF